MQRVFSAEKSKRRSQKPCRGSCGTDIEFCAVIRNISAAADNPEPVLFARPTDSQLCEAGEHCLRILSKVSAGEKNFSLAEGRKDQRTVENAFGSGDICLDDAVRRKMLYLVSAHVKIIVPADEKVKKKPVFGVLRQKSC